MEQLEDEIQQLSHVEEIELQLSKAIQILDEEQMGIQVQLNEVESGLNKIDALGNNTLNSTSAWKVYGLS